MNNLFLLDVNMLIALAWPNHEHHGLVRKWFLSDGKNNWASCPITQTGFIRISSNRKIIESAVAPETAVALLQQLTTTGTHTFWQDSLNFLDLKFPSELLQGHRQITDAYLLQLAAANNGMLATLDRKLFETVKNTELQKNMHILS